MQLYNCKTRGKGWPPLIFVQCFFGFLWHCFEKKKINQMTSWKVACITSQLKFLPTKVEKLWEAINAKQNQIGTVCNDVTQMFKSSDEFVANKAINLPRFYVMHNLLLQIQRAMIIGVVAWSRISPWILCTPIKSGHAHWVQTYRIFCLFWLRIFTCLSVGCSGHSSISSEMRELNPSSSGLHWTASLMLPSW